MFYTEFTDVSIEDSEGTYNIKVTKDPQSRKPKISLEIDGLDALPRVIDQLIDMGVDLSATKEALNRVEEQRKAKEAKQKAREEIIAAVNEVRSQSKGERRFVISWLDEDDEKREIITYKGTEFVDGSVLLDKSLLNSVSIGHGQRFEHMAGLQHYISCRYPKMPYLGFAYFDEQ